MIRRSLVPTAGVAVALLRVPLLVATARCCSSDSTSAKQQAGEAHSAVKERANLFVDDGTTVNWRDLLRPDARQRAPKASQDQQQQVQESFLVDVSPFDKVNQRFEARLIEESRQQAPATSSSTLLATTTQTDAALDEQRQLIGEVARAAHAALPELQRIRAALHHQHYVSRDFDYLVTDEATKGSRSTYEKVALAVATIAEAERYLVEIMSLCQSTQDGATSTTSASTAALYTQVEDRSRYFIASALHFARLVEDIDQRHRILIFKKANDGHRVDLARHGTTLKQVERTAASNGGSAVWDSVQKIVDVVDASLDKTIGRPLAPLKAFITGESGKKP
jgi:hypothetical protein